MRLAEGPLAESLQLFALFGLAVAAPLLDLLARHPGFLVAHQLSGTWLAALVAGLLLLPPLAAGLALRAVALAGPRAAWALRAALAGALASAFGLPVLRALPGLPAWWAPLAAAGVLAGAVAVGFARRRAVRAFAALLAPLPLLPVALLFSDARVVRLLLPPVRPSIPPAMAQDLPPVVLVVFDELPTASLLAADGRIDRVLYPAFADLADHGTWFPRATTVGASTLEAVPAILTGRYPDPSVLPTYADQPENLFSLLAGAYWMHVHESQTLLHRDQAAGGDGGRARAGAVAADLGVLWLHAVLPAQLAARLPDVDHAWRDFAWPDVGALADLGDRRYRGRAKQFADFVSRVAPCARPCLHFLHTLLPHVPWLHGATGRRYEPTAIPGLRREFWGPEAWWVIEAHQRHLLQVAYADRLLGMLLERLRRVGLFEPALLVVTADHGSSFWPGQSRRDPDVTQHPEDILRVPLLVKRPGRRRGAVDDRPVESVDIVPTIAQVLGIAIPWRVDGCSAFDPACPERREQVIFDNGGHRYAFAVEALDRRASLERKLSLFGARPGEAGLYHVGPYRRWVGQPVDSLSLGADAALRVEIDATGLLMARAHPEAWAASRVVGRLARRPGLAARPHLAIATEGVLQALVPALPERDGRLVFAAQVPEDAFDGDPEHLAVYLVTGSPQAPVLHATALALGRVDLRRVGTDFEPPPRGAVR